MDNTNRAIDLLSEILIENDLNADKIKLTDISKRVKAELEKWLESRNIDMSVIDEEVKRAKYYDDERGYYVFSFYVNDPEIYAGIVIFEESEEKAWLLGESSKGSD